MHRWSPLAIALVVLTAGCLGSPSSGPNAPPGEESFTVSVDGNSTHSIYVAVHLYVEPPESVTLEYENGTTRELELSAEQGLVQGDAPETLRSVRTPEDDGGVYFEGPPAFSATAQNVTTMPTAVYVVRVDGRNQVAAWGVVSCDGHVDALDLRADDDTVTAGGIACKN